MGIVQELKKHYEIEDEWIGFELHPETPIEGIDLRERFGKEKLEFMLDKLRKAGSQYGITFGEFYKMPNSNKVIQGALFANENGKFHEYHEKIMYEYFNNAVDIGDINELARLAKEIGLCDKELKNALEADKYKNVVNEENKIARENGVSSTPTFIINNEHKLVGIQDINKFKELI